LALDRPVVVLRSFDRPNLSWSVLPGGSLAARASAVYGLLRESPGCAIVYAPTRRSVETVRDRLAGWGLRTEAYHAGLPGKERSRVQGDFMAGRCRIIVATNAFGMGIDKADVRTVAHLQLPGTLEAYYQEAGRAGRDGDSAHCVAFYSPSDRRLAAAFIDRTHPPLRLLRRLHRRLLRHTDRDGIVSLDDPRLPACLQGTFAEWQEDRGTGPLAALERAGAIREVESGDARGRTDPEGSVSPIRRLGVRTRVDLAAALRLRRHAGAKVAAVQRYARGRGCRRRALLRYFGEDAPSSCGSCDRCGTGPV